MSHRYARYFEMHDRSLWERRGSEYVEYLRTSEKPIYMQRVEPDIPMSVEFPLQQAIDAGRDYFNSSIAYMLALAVIEGQDVEVWGVDNAPFEEWAFERPCNEYWLGVLQGRGHEIRVHESSSLLRFTPDILYLDKRQHYQGRYGWLAETA